MKTEKHAARVGKEGTPLPVQHADRRFDISKNASIVHPERTVDNIYMQLQADGRYKILSGRDKTRPTCAATERMAYDKLFGKTCDKLQAKDDAQHHPGRKAQHTPEAMRQSRRTCPEEEIVQIGKAEDGITANTLWDAYQEYLAWEQKKYPQVVYLDVAMHMDETCPHIHARRVFVARDKDGDKVPKENEALRQMGVKPYFIRYVDKKTGEAKTKPSTLKQAYTKDCREHWEEILRARGIYIDTDRKPRSEVGLDFSEVKAKEILEAAQKASDKAQALRRDAEDVVATMADVEKMSRDPQQLASALCDMPTETKGFGKAKQTFVRVPYDDLHDAVGMLMRYSATQGMAKAKDELERTLASRPDIRNADAIRRCFEQRLADKDRQIKDLSDRVAEDDRIFDDLGGREAIQRYLAEQKEKTRQARRTATRGRSRGDDIEL